MSPILTGAWRQRPLEAAQHRLDPRHQFARAERFWDVIVGAQFQSENAVGFPAFRRQKNDRGGGQRRNLPDLAAQLEAVFARNHDVENEQRRPLPLGIGDDGVSGGEHFHRESIRFQMMPHQAGNIRIVFDHKDAGFHGSIVAGGLLWEPSLVEELADPQSLP